MRVKYAHQRDFRKACNLKKKVETNQQPKLRQTRILIECDRGMKKYRPCNLSFINFVHGLVLNA